VPEQVRDALAACRSAGMLFDEAWALVVDGATTRSGHGMVKLPHNTGERRGWREALEATRGEWESAYERRPSRLSMALDGCNDFLDDSEAARVRHRDSGRVFARLTYLPPVASIARPLLVGDRELPDAEAVHASFFAVGRARRSTELETA